MSPEFLSKPLRSPETGSGSGRGGDAEKPARKLNNLRGKMRDSAYLPSFNEILEAFDLEKAVRKPAFERMQKVWEVRPKFTEFLREQGILYEFYNQEYVTELGTYLVRRISEIKQETGRLPTLLEVGAGDGRLAHFLQEKIQSLGEVNCSVIATDSGESGHAAKFPVEAIDYKDALAKYKPDVVISSWMPMNTDWSKDIRMTESVQEYILIGDDTVTGSPWKTWGNASEDEEESEEEKPPFERDGFSKTYHEEMQKFQIPHHLDFNHVTTASFTRKPSSERLSEGLAEETAKKNLEEKREALQHLALFYNIQDGMIEANLNDVSENLKRQDMYTTEAQEKIMTEFREAFTEVAEAALAQDTSLYTAFRYFKALGREDKIRERVQKGYPTIDGDHNFDLLRACLEYGTDAQAESALREFLKGSSPKYTILEQLQETRYFKERLEIIERAYNQFAQQSGLRNLPRISHAASKIDLINGAQELRKRNYNLAIGVMRSGEPLAGLLDFLGQRTRYVEWHLGWKKQPTWRNIGSNRLRVKQAKSILLCEHDTETGATLRALIPFLQSLHPDKVDISFWIDYHHRNERRVKESGFYNEQFLIRDMPLASLIENVNATVEYARSRLHPPEGNNNNV